VASDPSANSWRIVSVVAHGNRIVDVCGDAGIFRSSDNGLTWGSVSTAVGGCTQTGAHLIDAKTPVLDAAEWRRLIDSIPTETVRDLRDRALIATLTYSFARIMAALRMKVEDLRPQSAGWRVQLHEKGGKQHAMPCHHALAEALRAYIDTAGIADDRKGWLFRTSPRHTAT
jgi:integrase